MTQPTSLGGYKVERVIAREGARAAHAFVGYKGGCRYIIKTANPMHPERHLVQEAEVLSRISHPNVVQLIERLKYPGSMYRLGIVLKYLGNTSLFASLVTQKVAPTHVIARILCSVIRGLMATHAAEDDEGPMFAIHGDLKPSNMMVCTERGHITLIDFGNTRHARDGRTSKSPNTGTPGFIAPETFRKTHGPGTDVFGLGCLATSLLAKAAPNPPVRDLSLYAIELVEGRFANWPNVKLAWSHPELGALIEHMMALAPCDRPSLEELLVELTPLSGDDHDVAIWTRGG